MKKKTLWIAAVALLVVAVLAVGLIVRHRQMARQVAGAITLKTGGRTFQVPLEELDQVAFSGETVNGKGERFTHDYRGVPLKKLLEDQQVDLGTVSAVTLTAADQFSAEYTIDEINEAGKVYLAVQVDGQGVEGIDPGTPGAQMVVFGDPNSKRNVRFLSVIETAP